MKKVGIVTFHCADNYGAVLQAYALSEQIKKINLDPEFINFTPSRIRAPYENTFNLLKNIENFGVRGGLKKEISNILNYKYNKERMSNFNIFRKKYLKISNYTFSNPNQIDENLNHYDIYITGSDQVWNYEMISGLENIYFLNFGNPSAKKISYAASIAKDLTEDRFDTYSKYLSKLHSISIREDSHKSVVERLSNKSVEIVLDPTLLHNQDFWKKSFNLTDSRLNQVLVYDLVKSDLIVDAANYIAEETGISIFNYSGKESYKYWNGSFKGKSPEVLLESIKNSDYVVTSSFHGMVFAIIFEKDFYVVSHPTRGSRMVDLLQKIGLENRIISSINDIDLNTHINYVDVMDNLSKMVKSSVDFLENEVNIE